MQQGACLRLVECSLETGQAQVFEYSLPVDGAKREYEARIVPTTDNQSLAIVRDITEQKQAALAVQRERDFVASVLDTAPALVVVLDRRGRIVRFNRACEQVTGYDSKEVDQKLVWELFLDPEEVEWDKGIFQRILSGQSVNDYENCWITKEGDRRLVAWCNSTVPDDEGKVEYVIRTGVDITERKEAEDKIRFLAYYDELTGLANRALFMEHLNQAIANSERHRRLLAVVFLDIDRFKNINDTLGHHVGDALLKEVGNRLKAVIRKSDYVARYEQGEVMTSLSRFGGDEFTVFLTDLRNSEAAAKVTRRLLEEIAAPFELEGKEIHVTASAGISVYPFDGTNVDTLLGNANVAMNSAKQAKGNDYRFYSQSMNANSQELLVLENDLRKAIEQGDLRLYYQPKVVAQTGEVAGLETLVRWQHPSKGILPPSEFIEMAEETGLIVPIGTWVMHAACQQNVAWQASGLSPVRIAVNLSSLQFNQKNLLQTISQVLEETNLDPCYLELEITESTLMHNAEEAARALEKIKALGIKIAIDDFGTGYSSLSYVKSLPVDTIKIDRCFVRYIPENKDDTAITIAIIKMAHTLGLKVIAEGVETEDQLEFLKSEGCEEIQGYFFSPPVPAHEIESFLTGSRPAAGNYQTVPWGTVSQITGQV